jgi:hypothetical protein
MTKSQRRYFPQYEAAYRRARVILAISIIARIVAVTTLMIFLWAASDGQVTYSRAIVTILALFAFGGVLMLADQILSRIRTFAFRISAEAYAADPRARAARDAGAKAYAKAVMAGANHLAAQAAYDAAIAVFVESDLTSPCVSSSQKVTASTFYEPNTSERS